MMKIIMKTLQMNKITMKIFKMNNTGCNMKMNTKIYIKMKKILNKTQKQKIKAKTLNHIQLKIKIIMKILK